MRCSIGPSPPIEWPCTPLFPVLPSANWDARPSSRSWWPPLLELESAFRTFQYLPRDTLSKVEAASYSYNEPTLAQNSRGHSTSLSSHAPLDQNFKAKAELEFAPCHEHVIRRSSAIFTLLTQKVSPELWSAV